MVAISGVPMMRKGFELISLLYARKLDEERDGLNGYILATRSVWESEKSAPLGNKDGLSESDDYVRSEMLLGVNLVREVKGHSDRCELTTVTHFHTPGVNVYVAKPFGMKAARNFIQDIRDVIEKR